MDNSTISAEHFDVGEKRFRPNLWRKTGWPRSVPGCNSSRF